MDLLKIKPWGPPRLRAIIDELVDAINRRTPKEGFGTRADEKADGVMVHAELGASGSAEAVPEDGNVTGGTPAALVGALNGQPATYHLLQSAPPTPIT